jgi:isopenicillin-N epimerase
MAFGHAMRPEWPLDPSITYLNHGTVGVTPRKVLAAQQALRDEMERQPSRFMLREVGRLAGAAWPTASRMRRAAHAVAAFLGSRGDDLVFVDNATAGVNAVLRSLSFSPGDEILLLDHAYGAVLNAASYRARESGAVVRTVEVPWPSFDERVLVGRIASALSPRTRILILDHITSSTAILLPVAEIAAECRARGVAVLVDGAHAPGAIPLDIAALGVDWYTANLHKWAQAPRSCGILWAALERQRGLHPPVISWGLDQGFNAEFDWVGTRDPTPWLAAPAGLQFLADLDFAGVSAWNHGMACESAHLLCARWHMSAGVPDRNIATMATVPAPERFGGRPEDAARLRDALLFDHHIEVHVFAAWSRVWVRVSAQLYNDRSDVERLGEAVERC